MLSTSTGDPDNCRRRRAAILVPIALTALVAAAPALAPNPAAAMTEEVIEVIDTRPPGPCVTIGFCLPDPAGGLGMPLESRDGSRAREGRPKGVPSPHPPKPKDEAKPKREPEQPKSEEPRKPPTCGELKKVIESGRFIRAHRVWRTLQDRGVDRAVPRELSGWMNEIERLQRAALAWNQLECGSPLPIIDLPSLSV